MVHICKMMTYPVVFFIFKKILTLRVVRGKKGQKIAQNDKKILSFLLRTSGTVPHMIVVFGTHLQNDDYIFFFFIF